jgi:hypothetical protein
MGIVKKEITMTATSRRTFGIGDQILVKLICEGHVPVKEDTGKPSNLESVAESLAQKSVTVNKREDTTHAGLWPWAFGL